ncbi:MAG: hypothetical protein IBJ07_08920 [Rhizobiaceae bacterium]|nr:hypothetical protein [Rhizobiaceae bacterium]
MNTIRTMKSDLMDRIAGRLDAAKRANKTVKGVFVAGAAAVAGIAQFADFSGQPSVWQMAGITATSLVLLGALYSIFVEKDAEEELKVAAAAIDAAQIVENEYRQQIQLFDEYAADARKATNLYLAMHLMRGALERLPLGGTVEEDLAGTLLSAAHQQLPIALGFETHHQWTIGIYKAGAAVEGDGIDLKIAGDLRAIPCDHSNARRWPSGKGFIGFAHAQRREIIVDDVREPTVRGLFMLPGELHRPHDGERYVSFVSVPILVGDDDSPWGVAIATNDQSGHFMVQEPPGVHAAEAVRALAGMVALGVTMIKRPSRAADAQ